MQESRHMVDTGRKLNLRSKIVYSITFTMLLIAFIVILAVSHRFKVVMVVTGSMEPSIMTNSLSILDKCSIDDIKTNDIVMYRSRHGYSVTHRVVKIARDGDKVELYTKGDNNRHIDRHPVTEDNLIGKVVKTHNGIAKYISVDMKVNSILDFGTVVVLICVMTFILGIEVILITKGIRYIKKGIKNKSTVR